MKLTDLKITNIRYGPISEIHAGIGGGIIFEVNGITVRGVKY